MLATSATPCALRELVAQVPVLDRAQFGEVLVGADQCVLVDPADAGRIGSELGRNAPGEATGREVQVLQHPRARPVDVGAILEDDVDERRAEERKAPHDLGLGDGQHRARQRIGDLVLDDLRRLAGILGVDDDLDVGKIGQGVERRLDDRVDAAHGDEHGRQDDEERVARRPLDDLAQHDVLSARPAARRALCALPWGRLQAASRVRLKPDPHRERGGRSSQCP